MLAVGTPPGEGAPKHRLRDSLLPRWDRDPSLIRRSHADLRRSALESAAGVATQDDRPQSLYLQFPAARCPWKRSDIQLIPSESDVTVIDS